MYKLVKIGLLASLLSSAALANADGEIVLPASEARIEGTAILENGGQNIGVWSNKTDIIRWLALVPTPGRYRVQLVYSLAPGESGSTVSLSVGNKSFSVKPEATGSWTDYRPLDLGEVAIGKAGATAIKVLATDKPTFYVLNIKSINLIPLEVQAPHPKSSMSPGVVNVSKNTFGAQIMMGDGLLELRPLLDGAIRVRFSNGDTPTPQLPSLVLVEKVPVPQFALKQDKTSVTLTTSRMSAVVNRSTGVLSFRDRQGKIILAEKVGGRELKPALLQAELTQSAEQKFESPEGERIYGSGQFQDDELNIRDLPRRLTQVNMQIALPFVLSSRGYGLLWHNNGLTELNPAEQLLPVTKGTISDSAYVDVTTPQGTRREAQSTSSFAGEFSVPKTGNYAFVLDHAGARYYVEIDGQVVVNYKNNSLPPTTSWHRQLVVGNHTFRIESNENPALFMRPAANETVLRSPVAQGIDYIVFAGNPDEIISSYRKLTGPAPLMPIWNYGFIQCRERYSSQQQIVDAVAQFRKRQLPMDLIVQDWQYWGKYGWNAMQWDEKDYPDPAQMVRDIHAQNARLMVSVWSKIDPNSEVGKQFAAKNYYIPGTQWVDFFNPAAAALYWKNFSSRMLSLGIDAWWLDATEPENDDLVGRKVFVGAGEKVRLAYPLMVNKTVYEGLRRDAPEKRVSILTRSAFLGQQRYAAATWSGDIGSDWETLRRQIPAGLNFVVTGQPYWTTDTGGFWRPGESQYADPTYHERFLRWFQYSTFCPLQRVHGAGSRTELWNYGPDVEGEAKQYLDLRYRMLPYTYSQAAQVTFHGSTLMRPLVMDFPNDPQALDQKYEFSFGPSLLVAPVFEAGAKSWPVYLPQSEGGWFDFWTGRKLAGGQKVLVNSPLSQIPLHVRAGSIVPLGPTRQYTGEKPSDPIELRVYRGADAVFTLYEDEGTNNNYEKGAFATIRFAWNEKRRTLSIGGRQGTFPGMLRNRTFRVVWVRPGNGNGIAPTEKADVEVKYNGKALLLKGSRE